MEQQMHSHYTKLANDLLERLRRKDGAPQALMQPPPAPATQAPATHVVIHAPSHCVINITPGRPAAPGNRTVT